MIALRVALAILVVFGIDSVLVEFGSTVFATRQLLVVYLVATLPLAWIVAERVRLNYLLVAAGSLLLIASIIDDVYEVLQPGVAFQHLVRCTFTLSGQAAALAVVGRFAPSTAPRINDLGFLTAIVLGLTIPAIFLSQHLNRLRSQAVEAAQAGKLFRADQRVKQLKALGSAEFALDPKRLGEQITALQKRLRYDLPAFDKAQVLAQLGRQDETLALLDGGIESRLMRASILQDREQYEESSEAYRTIRDELLASGNLLLAERAQSALCFNARQRGHGPEALTYALEGLQLFSANPAIWKFQVGLAHDLADDPRSARAALEAAERLDPKLHDLVTPHLRRLKRGLGCVPR